jgi:lipid A 3-O-deacylase
MIFLKRITVFLFLLFQLAGFAQQADSIEKPERYFRHNYDNDFFSATDRYYTQGVRGELIMPFVKHSPVSKILFPITTSSKNYYGIALQRDGFTPRSIRHNTIYVGERPYASVFFLSYFLI